MVELVFGGRTQSSFLEVCVTCYKISLKGGGDDTTFNSMTNR